MSFPDRRTTDVLLTVAFFVAVSAIIYSARHILLIFVFAVFFAYLVNPIVKFMQTHSLLFRNLRGPAVVEVYISLVLLTAAAGYTFAPRIAMNTAKIVDEVPVVLDGLATGDIATQLATEFSWSEATKFRFKTFLVKHKADLQGLAGTVDRFVVNAAHVIGYVLLIPILAIFFLRDGDYIAKTFIQALFPADRVTQARTAAQELHSVLAKYMSAQVQLCILSFVFYLASLMVLRCPHAIALALLGGFLEFIPVAGWLTTFAAVVSVAIVSDSHWVWITVLLAFWRVLQDYLLCPRIMGRHLRIHPLAAIFAILVGAEVGGIIGIYLSIPLMASMRVVWLMCAVRGPLVSDNRRRPVATTELVKSPAPYRDAYLGATPAHAKAD